MANENIHVEILRNPTKADWARRKELASMVTTEKKNVLDQIVDESIMWRTYLWGSQQKIYCR